MKKSTLLALIVAVIVVATGFLAWFDGFGPIVTFEANGNVVRREKPADSGKTVEPPFAASTLSAYNYAFAGWYEGAEATKEFDFSTAVTKSITLVAKYREMSTGKTVTTFEVPEESTLNNDYAKYIVGDEVLGEVFSIVKLDEGYVFKARGYKGVVHEGEELTSEPYVTIIMFVKNNGTIGDIVIYDMYAQTLDATEADGSPAYAAKITAKMVFDAYRNKALSLGINVGSLVTGATETSGAIRYAVVAVATYITGTKIISLGMSEEEGNSIINSFYQGQYTKSQKQVSIPNNIGRIVYAADGVAGGKNVMAIVVETTDATNLNINVAGGSDPWGTSYPDAMRMAIIIDKSTNRVIAEKIFTPGGVSQPQYFTIPQDKLEAYRTVTISSGTVFDSFTSGLHHPVYDIVPDPQVDGQYTVITGTSIVYSGVTVDGTFTGQLARFCYAAAARFYNGAK